MGSKFAQLPFHVQEKGIFRKSICQDDQLNIWYLTTYVPFTSVYQTQYICTMHLTVCSYHVTYAFQSESTLYSCLNVKELLAWSRQLFVYELSGCGFKSCCSHLNFRYRACFEHGVPWHSGNYRVWIHYKIHTWHDKNI